jgi:hypothetical protein
MVRILPAAAAVTAILLFGMARSDAAYVGNAPWCAVVNIGMGTMEWNCQFASVEACRPNVIAGNRGFCALNPYYVPPARQGAPHRSKHRPYTGWS